ncbi:Holliday junction branch migration protein RuvA [Garciella nitratireducens]|uniref:Holliday junction branch migration protein RuvA n=1 Tax=Garciella nitratireducens TaxID=218205 RepID=UPI000DEA0501|nr:Holliday junction branch migration protein RuvA [Garciella nitratireducens]RBP46615.1 Holliday junction DNA helicase subunit RuvA [Garciella nitratireducens]
MFDYMKGTLEEILEDSIIIENNGIGYKIYISKQTLNQIVDKGSNIKIYIDMTLKEEEIFLYGFFTKEERNLYRKLISVSGVGSKVAMGILSVQNTKDLIRSIIEEDIKSLIQAPGIGKKTAQRIVLELRDKLKKEQSDFLGNSTNDKLENIENISIREEAINALITLGYSVSQSHRAVTSVFKENLDVETLIKEALKIIIS